MADKPVLDYANGTPTAAQRRRRWILMGSLVGGSIAAAAVRLALAQPKPATMPAMIDGDIMPPTPATKPALPAGTPPPPPTTQPRVSPAALPGEPAPPAALPGKPAAPLIPATVPSNVKGGVRAPSVQTDAHS